MTHKKRVELSLRAYNVAHGRHVSGQALADLMAAILQDSVIEVSRGTYMWPLYELFAEDGDEYEDILRHFEYVDALTRVARRDISRRW